MMTRPVISAAGRQRRHTSIHPDREIGSSESISSNNGHYKNSSPDHIIYAYEQISETGFFTRDSGNLATY